ncbi:proteasome regulatory non-ATP-ase subunit 7 [Trypanosoma equiperdum]|uniref:Proteasome regulatory non-ATP-ase subunit 7 n=2 Tax=Trypanozoon TaxID=39700 RepID=Q381I3_TRYB2|nr:proteasome regulatory non-ATPase subunit 7 [Trypanosoma brucei brucei TREU927]EAN80548.1 proteasome regulatory non-ATP-ase subunit 7 [Trypanosoma brucei brucei TREU927]SCU69630.1 proteasome regulatory non-ATP-ase subunit 7 [Trypanosoma equiperdum]
MPPQQPVGIMDNEEEFPVEEPPPMDPLIKLLHLRHTYTSQYVDEAVREEVKAAMLKIAHEHNMAPYLRFASEMFCWTVDEEQLRAMDAINATKLEELDARIKDAQENLGDVEVRDGLLARCHHFARIGDMEECLKFNNECSGKTLAAGSKLDLCFQRILLGLAFSDNEVAANGICSAHRLMKEGDWERRNRLKVYEGLFYVYIRDFKKGSELLLDSISTFAASELMDFNEFILVTVVASLPVLSRSQLKKCILDSPEVHSANIKNVFHLVTAIYECRYKEVFPTLDAVCQQLRGIVYLSQHVNYFFREVRVLVFKQFLDSYSSVTLKSMSNAFGIPSPVLDSMLGTLISNERIACKMDRVSDSITTYRGDTTNLDYHRIVKNGDLLLNRIQKLSRLAEV